MRELRDYLSRSPATARVAPFVIFLVLTTLQPYLGSSSEYWMYVLKSFLGVALIWAMWPLVPEMRWAMSWEAVAVGIGVFVIWVGLDRFYPKFTEVKEFWNPFDEFGEDSPVAWTFCVLRILGMGLVVPPLEEAFYRSFLYRYLVKVDFQAVPLGAYNLVALLACAGLFGFSHIQWLAGILCGLAYQGLVIKKNRLGDAMTAHAITNILLGIWVVWKKDWVFF